MIERVTLSENNIHILDSYQDSKHDFRKDLEEIRTYNWEYGNPCKVFEHRTIREMCLEWATHNALYALGLWKHRTKDVDLNYPNNMVWLYSIVGVLVWPFIR